MTKTIKTLLITILLTLGLTPAFAGSGHSHDASKYVIERNANYELGKLIAKGKLDKTWQNVKQSSIKKQGMLSKEWVIGFTNKAVKDPMKQTLYIYLTTYGKFIGANYKGD